MERRPVGDGMGGEKAGGSAQAWVAYPPNMHQQPEWLDIPESPPLRFTHSQNARLLQGRSLGKRRLSPSPENEPVNPPKRSSSGLGPLPDQVDPADLHTSSRPGRAVAAQEPAGQEFVLQPEPPQDSSTARKAASRKSTREAPKNQSARAETPPTDRGRSLQTGKAEKPRTGRVEMWQSEKVNRALRAGQRQGHNTTGFPGPSAPPAQDYPYTTPLAIFERFVCEWPWEVVSCVRDYLADWEFQELQQWDPSQPQRPGSGAAGRALRYLTNIRGSGEQQAWVSPDLKQLVQLPPLDARLDRILAAQDLKQARLEARPQPPQPLTDLYDLVNRMHRLHLHMRERSLAVSEMHQPPRLSLAALHSENGDSDDAAQSHRIESLPRQHEPQQLVSRSGCNEPPEAPDSDDILSTGLSEMSIRGSTTGPVTEPEEGRST